jgi:hypothetical protein
VVRGFLSLIANFVLFLKCKYLRISGFCDESEHESVNGDITKPLSESKALFQLPKIKRLLAGCTETILGNVVSKDAG